MKKKEKDLYAYETIDMREKKIRKSSIISGLMIIAVATYFCLSIFAYMEDYPRKNIMDAFNNVFDILTENPLYFWPVTGDTLGKTFFIDMVIAMICFLSYLYRCMHSHNNVNNIKGSAKWANPQQESKELAEIEDGSYKNAFYNAIFSKNFYMSLNMKKHFRALNTLIIGTTGSGKSRYFLKPNVLQMNTSYVITDPSGGILQSLGETLVRFGYNVRVFDVMSMKNCNTYNPLKYCYREADIRKVVDAFIKNTNLDKKSASGGDPFWDKAMMAYLCAIVALLVDYGYRETDSAEERDRKAMVMSGKKYSEGGTIWYPCFSSIAMLTQMANQASENASRDMLKNNTASGSILNEIFERVRLDAEERTPGIKPYCLVEWGNFKIAPEKTSTTILMTAAVQLDIFNIKEVRELTSSDTIELDTFGNSKDALFVITPTNVTTYNCLVSFLYTQLFDILYNHTNSESA